MNIAIETLERDITALHDYIQQRFEANLGVSGFIWEARCAAQTELTKLRKERDAQANAELQTAWRDLILRGGI